MKNTRRCNLLNELDSAAAKYGSNGKQAEANSIAQAAYFLAATTLQRLARRHYAVCGDCRMRETLKTRLRLPFLTSPDDGRTASAPRRFGHV